jgi:hypothetical protein
MEAVGQLARPSVEPMGDGMGIPVTNTSMRRDDCSIDVHHQLCSVLIDVGNTDRYRSECGFRRPGSGI